MSELGLINFMKRILKIIILGKPLNNKQERVSTFTVYNHINGKDITKIDLRETLQDYAEILGRSNPLPKPYLGPIEMWTPSVDCDDKKQNKGNC